MWPFVIHPGSMFCSVPLFFCLSCFGATAMEPLAPLAQQPLWQAAEPISVNIDFDVPAFAFTEEIQRLRDSSNIEKLVAQSQATLDRNSAGNMKLQEHKVTKQKLDAVNIFGSAM